MLFRSLVVVHTITRTEAERDEPPSLKHLGWGRAWEYDSYCCLFPFWDKERINQTAVIKVGKYRDGTPDLYESAVGMNPATDDHNTAFAGSAITNGTTFFPTNTPTGYTYLEEYLFFMASPHTFVAKNTASDPTYVDIDLACYTLGFTNSPVTFTISNIDRKSTRLNSSHT